MVKGIEQLLRQINVTRMAENLWRIVQIPSPTCHERKAALVFAEMLSAAGAQVEVDETIYDSPNVIGRLRGNRPGKVFQLAGHIDHINVPHPEHAFENHTISGRGVADMKNGLAGILEIISVLRENDVSFPGEILVTVYGLHEAPDGNQQGLLHLIEQGIKGDAALVFEGPNDAVMIMAKGQSIWNITLERQGSACHELEAGTNGGDLLKTAVEVINALLDKNKQWQDQTHSYPLLGAETSFVGQFHYGDFYNRLPKACNLQGNHRWHPNHSFQEMQDELKQLLQTISCPEGIDIKHSWEFVGESYEVNPDEPVVQSLRKSYKAVTGQEIEVGGTSLVTDVCRLVRYGGVPAVLWGFDTATAHADYEFVRVSRMGIACQICLHTVLDYLHSNAHPLPD